MQDRYETFKGSEILTNGKYKEMPSLAGIVTDSHNFLQQVLSIRVSKTGSSAIGPNQYNIETQKRITNITYHNGLDLNIVQHDKETGNHEIYSPYSNPGYNVYTYLLCAYNELFHKKPILNFPNTDIATRNNSNHTDNTIAFSSYIPNAYLDVYTYLEHKELFQKDSLGISRIIPPTETSGKREDSGFGITGDGAILQFIDEGNDPFHNAGDVHKITVEKELINVFLHTLIDTNRVHAGPVSNLNYKKLSDLIYDKIQNPELEVHPKLFRSPLSM